MNIRNLYPYQKRAVDYIEAHEGCGLFLDMG